MPRAGCRHRAPAALGTDACLGSATGGEASADTSVLSRITLTANDELGLTAGQVGTAHVPPPLLGLGFPPQQQAPLPPAPRPAASPLPQPLCQPPQG